MSHRNKKNTIANENVLTKEYIQELKARGNGALGKLAESRSTNSGDLIFILKNLGPLPVTFEAGWIERLVEHPIDKVRFWAVKNIGKVRSDKYISRLFDIASSDKSSMVQREAVSSIGRLRNEKTIPIMIGLLSDKDPKIVCQAVRSLLVFKGNELVDNSLKKLISHDNETVKSVIEKEFFAKEKTAKSDLPHTETFPFLKNVVVNGDVREVMRYVPDESIHLTFTSPPYYNARDYSIYPSYEAYLSFLREVFEEVHRITKEGRFLIVNTSPVIVPRISRAYSSKRYPIPFDLHSHLSQIGWEFIDDIVWKKPEYSVKNRIGGFQQHRKPLAYKPNSVTEYLMVYRKRTDKLIDWNIKQYDRRTVDDSKVGDGFETTNVWEISPKSDKMHSAIFPVDLCKRAIEYYSFKGDIVFDPFGGSGTLARTAKSLDREFFLTEIDPEYFEYMRSSMMKDPSINEREIKFVTFEQFKKTTK